MRRRVAKNPEAELAALLISMGANPDEVNAARTTSTAQQTVDSLDYTPTEVERRTYGATWYLQLPGNFGRKQCAYCNSVFASTYTYQRHCSKACAVRELEVKMKRTYDFGSGALSKTMEERFGKFEEPVVIEPEFLIALEKVYIQGIAFKYSLAEDQVREKFQRFCLEEFGTDYEQGPELEETDEAIEEDLPVEDTPVTLLPEFHQLSEDLDSLLERLLDDE